MIPAYLNDGFTQEAAPGVFCRPMLWIEKKEWKELAVTDPEGAWLSLVRSHVWNRGDAADQFKSEVINIVLGYTSKDESRDFQDLSDSIQLHATNPGLSVLSCSTCRKYCVNHEDGTLHVGPSGEPTILPGGIKVPCETHRGCLKGHWSEPNGLSNERWLKTWRHYWRYRTDCPMQDELWHRNRMLIEWTVLYGRDKRLDPFAGGSSDGGTADVSAKGSVGQDIPGASCI